MKTFNDLTIDERREIIGLFANWLKSYTHAVIVTVMEKRDEILNNEFAMNLLKELKSREEEEKEDFTMSLEHLFSNFDTFKEFDPHNHPLTHASSYRDILYDMYIQ